MSDSIRTIYYGKKILCDLLWPHNILYTYIYTYISHNTISKKNYWGEKRWSGIGVQFDMTSIRIYLKSPNYIPLTSIREIRAILKKKCCGFRYVTVKYIVSSPFHLIFLFLYTKLDNADI